MEKSRESNTDLLFTPEELGVRARIIGYETQEKPKRHIVYLIEVDRGGGNIEFTRRRYSAFVALRNDVRAAPQ